MKKLFAEPSLLFLLLANAYCLFYYLHNEQDYATVMWMYWLQSVTIGLFTFLDLLTFHKPAANANTATPLEGRGCTATFFLIHFGGFHLAYGLYLVVEQTEGLTHYYALLIALAGFMIEGIIQFRKQKALQNEKLIEPSFLFMLPYLRIIPMHLMILGPIFLHWQPGTIFILLKVFADLISFFLYRKLYFRA